MNGVLMLTVFIGEISVTKHGHGGWWHAGSGGVSGDTGVSMLVSARIAYIRELKVSLGWSSTANDCDLPDED